MKTKVILHLESEDGWGGQEIRILEESKGLQIRGYTVILGVQKGEGLFKRAKEMGFIVYKMDFKKWKAPYLLLQIIFLILKHKVSVVSTHSSLDSWIGGFAGKLLRRKVMRTRHLSTPIRKGLNSVFLYNFLADTVVTTSLEAASMIKKQARLSEKRCFSIPTGVNLEKMCLRNKEKPASEFTVGTLCIVRSWKGISDLLKAAKILESEPNLHWKIIGGGLSEEHFKKECKELKLENKVTFTGYLENPFEELASLDVFLLLSRAHEGVSQACLQAAWLKKPLITTRTGGLKEICIDNVNGFLVDACAPNQVAEAVLKLQASLKLRESFGENAHQLVKEKFTFSKTLNDIEKVYRNLLKSA